MFDFLADPEAWIALGTLTALEIVLGLDNIVFIAILVARVPVRQRNLAYRLGLGGAMLTRIALLCTISWVMGLTADLFRVAGHGISGRDIVLLVGGIFLIGKSAHEIYEKVEHDDESVDDADEKASRLGLALVIGQIMVLDIVFSLDSVITAVGMANDLPIMIAAIMIAVGIMLVFARKVGDFVNKNPSIKVLALSFLMLIGVLLTAEALDQHVDKAYIYFAMGFALMVEVINIRMRKKAIRRETLQAAERLP
jgi:predicted tellurium resistance membrane protein TerC